MFDKSIYFLSEGDTVRYLPTGQIGIISKIHTESEILKDKFQLRLIYPDKKIWASWSEIELVYPLG